MRHWISFDLGLRGEYDLLYAWLDRQQAKECGQNLATFQSSKTREELVKELSKTLNMKRNPRIYMVNMKQGGKWVIGRRTISPWTGFGQIESEPHDESDE